MTRRSKKKAGLRNRPAKEARLNMILDPELKEWIQRYAVRKHTSVTAIVTRHFVSIREMEEGDNVKQI